MTVVKFLLLFFIALSVSCKSSVQKENNYSVQNVIGKQWSIVGSEDSTHLIIYDLKGEKYEGGYYEFYPNKVLQSYKYFYDSNRYSYAENFDSLGTRLSTIGLPLVFVDGKNFKKDSFLIMFYLFNLHRSFTGIDIKVKQDSLVKLTVIPDTTFSNMSLCSFKYWLHRDSVSPMYIKASYIDTLSLVSRVFYDTFYLDNGDTINIYRKPRLGTSPKF